MGVIGSKDEWIDVGKSLIAVTITLMIIVSVASWLITGTVYFQLLVVVIAAMVMGVIGCIIIALVYRLLFGEDIY